MNVAKIIAAKRDAHTVSDDDLESLLLAYGNNQVADYQMAAFAMAVFFQGMNESEVLTLTRTMRDSGTIMQWPGIDKPVVDKHSTGGIGDKISIALAPMLASCGMAVPMISGRGLGPTGGTLDKLESIPGFRTDLSIEKLQQVVRKVGCVITGASNEIAPVDRELYALRDVTGTIPSVPLITGSILSKKLSEGLDYLVLDVKWGSGSFMKSKEQAEALADSLVEVATKLGTPATALLTDMNQPFGCVGNAIEVDESIELLKNNVDVETISLTVALGAELMVSSRLAPDHDTAISSLSDSIRSGAAYETFEQMVSEQGGDLSRPRPRGKEHVIESPRQGFIAWVDAEALGWAVIDMEGGRKKKGDAIDHSTGIEWLTRIGNSVGRGQPIFSVYSSDDQFQRMRDDVVNAVGFSDDPVDRPKLIVKRITASSLKK